MRIYSNSTWAQISHVSMAALFTLHASYLKSCILNCWKSAWQPISVLLPGESQGPALQDPRGPPLSPALQDPLVKLDLLLGGRLAPAPLLSVTFALIRCTFSFPFPLSHLPGISQSQQKLLKLGGDLTSLEPGKS